MKKEEKDTKKICYQRMSVLLKKKGITVDENKERGREGGEVEREEREDFLSSLHKYFYHPLK